MGLCKAEGGGEITEENLISQHWVLLCASLPVERGAVPNEAQNHSGGV